MKATIEVPYTNIQDLFAPEDKVLSNNRASYSMEETSSGTTFIIQAKDAVALRAMMSGITKALSAYEKVKSVIANDN